MVHDLALPATGDESSELAALRAERDALRARLESLERERAVESKRAAAVMADAQERVYWLERLHIDLNALMDSRAGPGVRAALAAGARLRRLARRIVR